MQFYYEPKIDDLIFGRHQNEHILQFCYRELLLLASDTVAKFDVSISGQ